MSFSQLSQLFADQFEPDGAQFIYRKSQKGAGYRVTADARDRFGEDFNRRMRWAMWLIMGGTLLVLGAAVGLSMYRETEPSRLAIFLGMAFVMVPYIAYFQWAWSAPARELSGRIPVAPKRSADEARRLQFGNITYGQLVGAAFLGLALPFFANEGSRDFSGWNILWLVGGGALLLLAMVQAFRKWRFERHHPTGRKGGQFDAGVTPHRSRLLPYLPFLALLAGLAFIAFTPVGRAIAQKPTFWTIVLLCVGSWALVTVARGFARSKIEPFLRGFQDTYQRDTQPKRFWASMAWNSFFGVACISVAFQMPGNSDHEQIVERCYDMRGSFSPEDVRSACDRLFEDSAAAIRQDPADAYAYYNRGFVHLKRGNLEPAIADFTEVIRLRPDQGGAYFYRWSAFKDLGDEERAKADLEALARMDPEAAATLRNNG